MRTTPFLLSTLLSALPAKAIEITLNFDTSEGNFPYYDPDGKKLEAISKAAAAIWMTIHPGTDSFHWNIHWEELDTNSPTLAVANSIDGSIRVRTNLGGPALTSDHWFFDPTPHQDEEFENPVQELYRDATPEQKAWLFNNAPALLEIGHTLAGKVGTAATGYDLLSFMLHEMGHLSGITYNDFAPDVPIPAHFIGNRAGVKVQRADDGHIGPVNALMDPGLPPGRRAHPSALDIMVNANEKGWTEINLPRVEWLGDASAPASLFWQWPTGWSGGKIPVSWADVSIRDGFEISSFAPVLTGSLRMTEDSRLTSHAALHLTRSLRLSGSGAWDSPWLEMGSGCDVSGGDLLELDHGYLTLSGGTLSTETLSLLPGTVVQGASNRSTLSGHGNVFVKHLLNRDEIRAEGGTLHLTSPSGGTLDLSAEASGNATLTATAGDMLLHGQLAQQFFGTLHIGTGYRIEVADELRFGAGGGARFTNTTGTAKLVNASPQHGIDFDFDSWISLDENTHAEIVGNQIIFRNTDISIPAGGILACLGPLHSFWADQVSGDGTLMVTGDMSITGENHWSLASIDWDGKPGSPTTTTVLADGRLSLSVDDFAGTLDYVGHAILEEDAELAVDIAGPADAWTLAGAGSIELEKNANIAGDTLHLRGEIRSLGAGNGLGCPIILEPSGALRVSSEARLDLKGAIEWKGGYVGTNSGVLTSSTLGQFAPADVRGSQHVMVGFFAWDGSDATDSSTTIPGGAQLTIRALKIGSSVPGERDGFGDTIFMDSSILDMDLGGELLNYGTFLNEWTLNSSGVIHMDHDPLAIPPEVKGATLTNDGTITGKGTFSSLVINRGMIMPGHAAGTGRLAFGTQLTHESGGCLRCEIGGLTPEPAIDQITGGSLELNGGSLEVEFINGYVPEEGKSFQLLVFPKITGTFASVHLPSLPLGLKWDPSALYTAGTLSLVVDTNDTDADGLPDDWETDHFDNLARNGDDDFDGDGQSNLWEYLAATLPDNPTSRPKFRMVSRVGNTATVAFSPIVPNRLYTLWRSQDLSQGSWLPLPAATAEDIGNERWFTDHQADGNKSFYLLKIQVAP